VKSKQGKEADHHRRGEISHKINVLSQANYDATHAGKARLHLGGRRAIRAKVKIMTDTELAQLGHIPNSPPVKPFGCDKGSVPMRLLRDSIDVHHAK
jgi:hypothetical protein